MSDAEEMMESVKTGDYQRTAILLSEDPRLANAKGRWSWTPLHYAAERGRFSILALLVARGADVMARDKYDGSTPLHWAACRGYLRAAQLLVAAGADVNATDDRRKRSPLGWSTALAGFHPDVAEFLLSQGARLDIFSAIALDKADAVRKMIRHSHERAGRCEYLISWKRDRAVSAIVRCDPNVLSANLGACYDNRQPIHFASMKGSVGIVELLLESGADLHAKTASGRTPLCIAAEAMRNDIVDFLLARGAEIDPLAAKALGRLDSASPLIPDDQEEIEEETPPVVYRLG